MVDSGFFSEGQWDCPACGKRNRLNEFGCGKETAKLPEELFKKVVEECPRRFGYY